MADIDLSGKVALVTGGAMNLGECEARAFASAGATVVIADIEDTLGAQVAESIGGHFVHIDVTDDSSWEAGISAAVAAAGGLDILVNNAGVEIANLLVDLDPQSARTMLEVNVLGTALGLKHAFRAMRPGGAAGHGGVIVNTASVASTIAFPSIAVYSATKSAVDRLTRVAAMESGKLGYGVRVNCVYPGLIPNAMGARLADEVTRFGLFESPEAAIGAVIELTPSGRLATQEDIANAVLFLTSDNAAFVNGVGLPVDGGMGM